MKRKMFIFAMLLLSIAPSRVKILCLRIMGAKIGTDCYIGLSVIDAKSINIGNNTRIGHFNIIKSLNSLSLATGSKIESFNWITGGGLGDFTLGARSSVRRFHFFEASGCICIGSDSVIAGRSSLFYTHGLSPESWSEIRQITIGDWAYVGAAARFLPGSGVSVGSFVGMGTVVTKFHPESYVLIAGCPGRVIRSIDPNSTYFKRGPLRHAHHPRDLEV